MAIFWKGQWYGKFYLNLDVFRRNLDIFNCFKGALDHLLTRTQFWRFSLSDLLSLDLRLCCLRRKSPLIEKRRLLSFPVRLSMNDRSVRCMERTSVSLRFVGWLLHRPPLTLGFSRWRHAWGSTVLCDPSMAHFSPIFFPFVSTGVEHGMHLSPVFSTSLIKIFKVSRRWMCI